MGNSNISPVFNWKNPLAKPSVLISKSIHISQIIKKCFNWPLYYVSTHLGKLGCRVTALFRVHNSLVNPAYEEVHLQEISVKIPSDATADVPGLCGDKCQQWQVPQPGQSQPQSWLCWASSPSFYILVHKHPRVIIRAQLGGVGEIW